MRVWIGCLACYNDGRSVGEWFPAEGAGGVTLEQVHVNAGGVREDCEELWVMDIDEAPHSSVCVEMSPQDAGEIAALLKRLEGDGVDAEAFFVWCDYEGRDPLETDAIDFHEAYAGAWDSQVDFAENLAEDMGALDPDASWPIAYIDWERAARDLFSCDYYSVSTCGGVHVFRNV